MAPFFTKDEQVAYEASLKAYRDSYAIAITERKLGFAEGEAKGEARGLAKGETKGKYKEKIENARNLKSLGVDFSIISKALGLSIEEIEKL